MVRLKVGIVGTSPAETLRLEEALNQIDCLDTFRYLGLEQALEAVPNWEAWDLILARYDETRGAALLSLLAPVLRGAVPPVFFLVEAFDPHLVIQLLNAGGLRVLPVDVSEPLLLKSISGVFPRSSTGPVRLNSQHESAALPPESSSILDPDFVRLFQASPIGISIYRLQDGKCVDCNERFARLLEWPRDELIGRDALELDVMGEIKQQLERGLQAESALESYPLQVERKIYTRTRRIRQVQVHLDRIDWAGEPCIIALVEDITENEQGKEKVKRLNDELERLVLVRTGALEAANRELAAEIGRRKVLEDISNQLSQILWETPDVVAVYSPDGQMQFLNKAGRALFGLDEIEAVSNLDLFTAYPPELRTWIQHEVHPLVLLHGIWRGETAYQLADGRIIPLSQVLLCKRDELGEVQYFASIARDISYFKRVEQELRQSREHYRVLAEAAHDLIFMVSTDGRMEYANGFACRVLGVAPEAVEGLPASQFFPKDFADNHLKMFSEVHEIDQPIYTEGPFTLVDQQYWLGTWLVPIHDEHGNLLSILGISRDVTEQKKTDEALQRALQSERKLNEMRSSFFSMTSHQFRTPLSTILLSAELLQKYGQRWDDDKRAEHLGRIQEAAKRLNNMLEDLLVIGRAESGRYVCSPKEFDLAAFFDQAVKEMVINDSGRHEFIFQHDPPALLVYHDPEVMRRVVDNLLSNAIKVFPRRNLHLR